MWPRKLCLHPFALPSHTAALQGGARSRGDIDWTIFFVGLGSGLLLGDLDVLMGLQQAGFTIAAATFVDLDYRENCQGALAEVAGYLAPAPVVAFASSAEYAVERLLGRQPAANLFAQIDCDDISFGEAVALSTIALGDEGGGLGFRLANQHHPTLLPMVSWHRLLSPSAPYAQALGSIGEESETQGDRSRISFDAIYARILKLVNFAPLIAVDTEPVPVCMHDLHV
eukprot:CAMPEP_0115871032 /NCGR_PEP_ID=MMETSP0287-20121206/22649_1 /TAXON_ID=412157 /ORGANISM="Chrysochromulina rotalis, Strain UIO044" /LENGTH=226 /DNA_ID=CAMNT_0003325805 /DNA_START=66 /DNA_END=746 /DNA_ORIENTATION=-